MNKFIIEQTKNETQLAVALHQNADLSSIRLARASCAGRCSDELFKKDVSISLNIKSDKVFLVSDHLTIEVNLQLAGTRKPTASEEETLFSINCSFEAIYILRPEFTPSDKQIDAFKEGNAIFNCWPYCRQHVQDMIQRMGLPPITLPFLRVMTKQSRTEKKHSESLSSQNEE
jgi:preprotein translocase subunit SecB